jgi:hypothetical protein
MDALGPENQIEVPIIIQQGADFSLPILVVDLINYVETPTDLTGWSAHMQGRLSYGSDETIFDISSTGGGIFINPTAGTITCNIAGAVTATFPIPTKGRYDLKIFDNTGAIDRYLQGPFYVSPEVTQ